EIVFFRMIRSSERDGKHPTDGASKAALPTLPKVVLARDLLLKNKILRNFVVQILARITIDKKLLSTFYATPVHISMPQTMRNNLTGVAVKFTTTTVQLKPSSQRGLF